LVSQWVGVAVLALGALVAGVMFGGRSDPPPVVAIAPPAVAGPITVHITGAVAAPGLVVIDAGSRVADVVAAAGGLTAEAAPQGLNLAAPVRDGMQVVVPAAVVAGPTAAATVPSMSTATHAELRELPGLGPVLAQRIIDYRQANGPFATMEDLLGITGIGESKLAALRDAAVP
jgi:competence protein ComEA